MHLFGPPLDPKVLLEMRQRESALYQLYSACKAGNTDELQNLLKEPFCQNLISEFSTVS